MNLCNINDINDLLSRNGFKFSKSMGQNFLTAAWVPERISEESGADKETGVLEIGPGIGCLTEQLALRATKVVSVELDYRLLPILDETVGKYVNVSIISGDIMKCDVNNIVSDNFTGLKPIVCANLPYNITSPVITKLVESGLFDSITVMIQREVAKRICAKPGTADYSAFTIFCNFYTTPELLFDVPPSCFQPQPKVTSSVIRMKMRTRPAVNTDETLFFRIVRAAFNQRRKTLQNALSSAISEILKEQINESITEAGFDARVRGEVLSIDDFAKITDSIKRRINDN